MEKLNMKSPDLTVKNVERIAELFPQTLTEAMGEDGKLKKAIDFDLLKQELSNVLVEGPKERYQLTWPGKKEAILNANTPIDKTLRPVKEDSVNWDTTENLYIEGDNLEVLKLLQESYLGKVKCIYIDPPYNTGKDFVYSDNYNQDEAEYLEESGQVDDLTNRLLKNTESNGKFHSDWVTMMYSRLKVSRNLLTQDGAIFISIADKEIENLKKICNEVFGESNFVGCVVWERGFSPVNTKKHFSENHDFIICYAKNLDSLVCHGIRRDDASNERYSNPDNDERGPWTSGDLSVGPIVATKVYEITTPSGRKVLPPSGYCWRLTRERFEEFVKDNRIWFGEDGSNVPRIKRFLSEVKVGITPMTVWRHTDVGHSQEATQRLKELFDGEAYFDYPKPVKLIQRLFELYADSNSLVLDFFSGSATTAHAVMQLNAEDGGNRKYIMVQVPEPTPETSEARKAGYETICEIGKERIRRAAKKIQAETGAEIDYGFRVYRTDSSNMKDIYYTPDKLGQADLLDYADNIKEDRTGEDLLIQVMLEKGLPLSLKMESKQMDGCTVHYVAGNSLVACFDANIPTSLLQRIAQEDKPAYFICRDSSFADDSARINVEEIFKLLSPITDILVL